MVPSVCFIHNSPFAEMRHIDFRMVIPFRAACERHVNKVRKYRWPNNPECAANGAYFVVVICSFGVLVIQIHLKIGHLDCDYLSKKFEKSTQNETECSKPENNHVCCFYFESRKVDTLEDFSPTGLRIMTLRIKLSKKSPPLDKSLPGGSFSTLGSHVDILL